MSAAQIAKSKGSTFKQINAILGKHGKAGAGFTPDSYSIELRAILADKIDALRKPNAAALRDNADPTIRKILDF